MKEKRRKRYLILTAAVFIALTLLLASLAIGIFCEGSARKAENPTESIYTPEIVADRMLYAAPLLIAAVALTAAGLIRGIRDEKAERPVRPASPVRHKTGTKRGAVIRVILVIAAILLIAAGILNGSARDVLVKAVTICTECVGLG